MELDGKAAIVTGGAVRLAEPGAGAGRAGGAIGHPLRSSAGPAETVVEEIKAMGTDAASIQADLSRPGEARSIVERAAARFGQVDILVNTPRSSSPVTGTDTTEANWDRHFALI